MTDRPARYRRPPLRLEFEGDLAGLAVTCRRPTIGDVLDLEAAADREALAADLVAGIAHLCDVLGRLLVDWNLDDDDGTPVPATGDGLRGQDMGLIRAILAGILASTRAPRPLPPPSSDGDPPQVASLPMDPLPAGP